MAVLLLSAHCDYSNYSQTEQISKTGCNGLFQTQGQGPQIRSRETNPNPNPHLNSRKQRRSKLGWIHTFFWFFEARSSPFLAAQQLRRDALGILQIQCLDVYISATHFLFLRKKTKSKWLLILNQHIHVNLSSSKNFQYRNQQSLEV